MPRPALSSPRTFPSPQRKPRPQQILTPPACSPAATLGCLLSLCSCPSGHSHQGTRAARGLQDLAPFAQHICAAHPHVARLKPLFPPVATQCLLQGQTMCACPSSRMDAGAVCAPLGCCESHFCGHHVQHLWEACSSSLGAPPGGAVPASTVTMLSVLRTCQTVSTVAAPCHIPQCLLSGCKGGIWTPGGFL